TSCAGSVVLEHGGAGGSVHASNSGDAAAVSSGSGGGTGESSSSSSSSSSSGGDKDAGAPISDLRFQQCVGSCAGGMGGSFTGAFSPTSLGPTVTSVSGVRCPIISSSGPCVVAECMVDGHIFTDDAGPLTISGGAIPAGTTVTLGPLLGPYMYEAMGT